MRDARDCCAIGTGRYIPGMCPIHDVDRDEDSDENSLEWPNCCGIGGRYISSDDCPVHGQENHDDDSDDDSFSSDY